MRDSLHGSTREAPDPGDARQGRSCGHVGVDLIEEPVADVFPAAARLGEYGQEPAVEGGQKFRPAIQFRVVYDRRPVVPCCMDSAFAMYVSGVIEQCGHDRSCLG